jgi:hypothetical protein
MPPLPRDAAYTATLLFSPAVLNGKPETIGGSFNFDPSTDIDYGALLSFNGMGDYAFDVESIGRGNQMLVDGPIGDGQTDIIFANDLSFGTDPLAEVIWDNARFIDSAPTGFVVGPPRPSRPPNPLLSPSWAGRSVSSPRPAVLRTHPRTRAREGALARQLSGVAPDEYG